MSAEEIQAQQMGGLGDLTEPIKRERGEFFEQDARIPRRGGIPSDIARPQNVPAPNFDPSAFSKPGKVPPIEPGTLPIYDTLPANAGRSNFSAQPLVVWSAVPTDLPQGNFINRVVLSQVIQDGRVFFANKLRVNVIQTYDNANYPDTTYGVPQGFIFVTLKRNGEVEIYNQDIGLAPLDGFFPVWLWAGPGDLVEVLLSADYSALASGEGGVDVSIAVQVNLTGDILVTNKAPYPYTGLVSPKK